MTLTIDDRANIWAKPSTDDKLKTFVGHDAALSSRPTISFTGHRIATRE
jgi:hypothetical protein